MGDMLDHYQALREQQKQRREEASQANTQLLIDNQISFDEKNDGAHLVVRHKNKVVDFWPSTGRYRPRDGSKPGFGAHNLIKYFSSVKE